MIGKRSASGFNVHQRRPDFVMHVQLDDNKTTRLFAFRDTGSSASASGSDGFPARDDERRRTLVQSAALGVGLQLNALTHRVDLNSVQASAMTQEDYDAKG